MASSEGLLVFGPGARRQRITATILDNPGVSDERQFAGAAEIQGVT